MLLTFCACTGAAWVVAALTQQPQQLYVSPAGQDSATGTTPSSAVKSLHRAASLVTPQIRQVNVAPGKYWLAQDGGAGGLNLSEPRHGGTLWTRWDGAPGQDQTHEEVLISGGMRIATDDPNWNYSTSAQAWSLPLPGSVPSDTTELFLNGKRVLPLRSIPITGFSEVRGGMGITYSPGTLPADIDVSPTALKQWRVVINYSWTVGHHTVASVNLTTRTILFEQRMTASGGHFLWIEGHVEALWPGHASSTRPAPPPQPLSHRQAQNLSGLWWNNDSAWGVNPIQCVQTGSQVTFTAVDPAVAHWRIATGTLRLGSSSFAIDFQSSKHIATLGNDNQTIDISWIKGDPKGWTQQFVRGAFAPASEPSHNKLRPTGPVCTQTTPSQTKCRPTTMPWRLVDSGGVVNLQIHSTSSDHHPLVSTDELVIALLQPPLITVHGTNTSALGGMAFHNLHLAHSRDPCPSSRRTNGTGQSQAWNNPLISTQTPRFSINNPACDCLMIVGGIGTGTKSGFAAAFTENLVVRNLTVTEIGGTGISVAFSSNASVSDSYVAEVGGNGFEFSRVQSAQLKNSRVTGYGLVLMGAAGVELDESPAVVSHNEFSAGVQNGGINLDCHDGCEPTRLRKNHLFNLGTLNQYGLSDGGAIHVDHSTGFVEVTDNKVHDIRAQGFNGGGLYLDDTTTNVLCRGNLFFNLKGGAIQWNKQAIVPGGVVNISNNVMAKSVNGTYSPVNGGNRTGEAFMEWNREGAVSMEHNVFFFDPERDGPLFSSWHGPSAVSSFKNVAMDYNLYVDTRAPSGGSGIFSTWGSQGATPFPGDSSMKGWQALGHDVHSQGAVHFRNGASDWTWADFEQGGGAAGIALGIQPLAMDDVGPDW